MWVTQRQVNGGKAALNEVETTSTQQARLCYHHIQATVHFLLTSFTRGRQPAAKDTHLGLTYISCIIYPVISVLNHHGNSC